MTEDIKRKDRFRRCLLEAAGLGSWCVGNLGERAKNASQVSDHGQ